MHFESPVVDLCWQSTRMREQTTQHSFTSLFFVAHVTKQCCVPFRSKNFYFHQRRRPLLPAPGAQAWGQGWGSPRLDAGKELLALRGLCRQMDGSPLHGGVRALQKGVPGFSTIYSFLDTWGVYALPDYMVEGPLSPHLLHLSSISSSFSTCDAHTGFM